MSASLSSISSTESTGPPFIPPDSPGSCVSSRLQEEYDEFLKYAVVVPTFDATAFPKLLSDKQHSASMHATMSQGQTNPEQGHDSFNEDDGVQLTPRSPISHHSSTEHTPQLSAMLEQTSDQEPSVSSFADSNPRKQLSLSVANDDVISVTGSDFTVSLDHDIARMDNLLDQWTAELKHNVLGEFGQAKLRIIQHHRADMTKEREKHAAECTRLQNEIEHLKELLHTFELSIERKDAVITNLTQGMLKQKQKFEMLRTFGDWKLSHSDAKRESFTGVLARRHHERVLMRRCWDAWHASVENNWKQRVEKACQAKAQQVCLNLTNDYEAQIKSLNESLESAKAEVVRLTDERERYEETMKKAFMRGVCALNMEAMSMFQNTGTETSAGASENELIENLPFPATIPQEPVFNTEPPGAPPPRVVVASQGNAKVQVTDTAITSQSKGRIKTNGKGKSMSVKVTGRSGVTASTTLNPPMSSVVVERHPPVNKQTIGQATASKFPAVKQNTLSSAAAGSIPHGGPASQRKLAGQSTPSSASSHVKIVE